MLSIIVAVDTKGGIGKNNGLLCHLPADLQHFKRITMGKPIIMGRRTFESIGKARPGRRNIVLTHNPLSIPDVEMVAHFEDAIQCLSDVEEAIIIGGAQLYQIALPFVDRIYMTRIEGAFDADTFFPEIDLSTWKRTRIGEHKQDERNAYDMVFYQYDRG